jgi:formylglycine-generating enzyme required for sulfatase activity
MMAGDYKAAREYAKPKAGQSAEMQRGEILAQRMVDEPAAMVRGANTLVGRETRLKLKSGVQNAIVKAASESGLSAATTFTINNEKRERQDTLKWDALHAEQKAEFARLGGVETSATDAAILAAYGALAANDLEAARKAAEGGKEDPLGAHLAGVVQDRVKRLAYEAAMKRAEELLAAKKPKDAVVECEKALEARPGDAKAQALLEQARSTPQTVTLDLGSGVSMDFVYISPGTFVMGGKSNAEGRHKADETPKHTVTLTKGFYLGKYEVTQAQFQAIMGSNPSRSVKDPNSPVDSTTYHQELEFCKKASERTKRQVRLPTEAEWEYACRAGTDTDWSHGSDSGKLGDYAWIGANSGGRSHPVGLKKPNAWGLYDMHGNIAERVADSYQRGYYASSPKEDPPGARLPFGNGNNGTTILRGGSYKGGTDSSGWDPSECGTRIRGGGYGFYDSWGFRVAMTAEE